jgi:carbamoyltransferase
LISPHLLRHYGKKTGEKNLALAGGCFMNALANGKILANTSFRKTFIPYAAADNGGAMGAALYVRHFLLKKPRPLALGQSPTPFLGPSYSDPEIAAFLKKAGIKAVKISSIETFAAEQIANKKLVGWFQGPMEFGERALGHRSILADPRTAASKERVNQAVKFRENFRPFAPSVLAEKARDYFDIPAGVSVPYMEQVYPVKPSKRRVIPAVVHQDGSARLQTVTQKSDPVFYRLLKAFESKTGIPVLLNTSFNRNGEPIVCSPEDALRTFFTCGLDYLILGSYAIAKSNQPKA